MSIMTEEDVKKQRRIFTLKEIPQKLLKIFLALYVIHPTVYFLMVAIIIGFENFISIGKIILILAPPIIITFTVVFIIINNKLKKIINRLLDNPAEDELSEIEEVINSYPLRSSLPLLIGCAGGPVLTGIIGIFLNVFFSVPQVVFVVLIGEITAFVVAFILFYFAKVYLYPSNREITYSPLSIFHKFSIPILSCFLVLLTIFSVLIYTFMEKDISESNKNLIAKTLVNTKNQYNAFLEKALVEIQSYSKTRLLKDMNQKATVPFLLSLQKLKKDNIEMYFYAYPDGKAPTSLKRKTGENIVANVVDRGYFKKIMKEGDDFAFSEALESRATKKEIIVAACPIKVGKQRVGIFGTTILIKTIKDMLTNTEVGDTAEYMIISKEGKIVYYPNKEFSKKFIGKDIKDDGDRFVNIENIMQFTNDLPYDVVFNSSPKILYKSTIPINNNHIILMIDKSEFYSALNGIVIRTTFVLLIMTLVIYFIIRLISKRISSPINNIISIFQKVSDGDLTVQSTDYIPDEFGELVRFLQILLTRLNNIIDATMVSSRQLSEASTSLSTISQTLSNSAQDQAASVEEITASLEESSSAVEMISVNSKEQTGVSTATFESMQHLKKIISEISNHAEQALDKANITTNEAQKGNELMQYAIMGMNSIENSTQKISEFVVMISDISDQVNLLALNAAIEAARAGEHGKGFAVVADEISKLAEETSASAKNITSLVESGRSEVEKGKEYVDQTSHSLYTIIENIQKTDSLVREITQASRLQTEASDNVLTETQKVMQVADSISIATDEQMSAHKEMSSTIVLINVSTQAVAAEAEEVASSSEEINAQADSLYDGIKFFKVRSD